MDDIVDLGDISPSIGAQTCNASTDIDMDDIVDHPPSSLKTSVI